MPRLSAFFGRLPMVGLVLLLLVTFSIPALAQDSIRNWNDGQDPLENAIGLHYGKLAGHGLSVRMPLRWWLYAQVGGGIWHTADDQKHNLGFELNYILRQDDRIRLFTGVGLGYFYHRELLSDTGGQEVWSTSKDWNFGGGVGMEVLMGPRWALQGELDFMHLGDSGDIKVEPQLGLHYYW